MEVNHSIVVSDKTSARRCQAISKPLMHYQYIFSIDPLGTDFSEIWIKTFMKMTLKCNRQNGGSFVSTSNEAIKPHFNLFEWIKSDMVASFMSSVNIPVLEITKSFRWIFYRESEDSRYIMTEWRVLTCFTVHCFSSVYIVLCTIMIHSKVVICDHSAAAFS